MLQQYLPLAVLKPAFSIGDTGRVIKPVATVPTACGIETDLKGKTVYLYSPVATVPTACGIET